MTISRSQMNRQLYGVGSLVGREKFGLGSKLKKFVRKVIPNEVADVAVKAAPFVAPFNPALGGAMAGLGRFDQTGSISRGVKSGLLTYGLGQGARYLGGAELQALPGTQEFGGLGGFTQFSSPLATAPQTITPISGSEVGGEQFVFGDADALGGEMLTKGAKDIAATSIEKTAPTIMESAKKLTSLETLPEGLRELGGKGLKAVFTEPVPGDPKKTQIDKLAIGATIAGGATYLDAKRLAKEADLVDDADEYTEEMYEADKARYQDYYGDIITPASFGLKKGGRVMYQSGSTPFGVPSITLDEKEDQLDIEALKETLRKYPEKADEITDFEVGIFKAGPATDQGPYPMDDKTQEEKEAEMLKELLRELNNKADGGIMRTNFAMGSDDPSDPKFSPQSGTGILEMDPLKSDFDEIKGGGGIGGLLSPFTRAEKSFLFKTLAKQGGSDRTFTMPQLYRIFKNPGKFKKDEQALKAFLKVKGFKEGGRAELAMGSEVPVRQNEGGIKELDYRETGGFVPVGIKEKADDVPAMLSKNEFVMTADAVRGIGNGDVETGAQKLYNLMKQAEKRNLV